MGLNVNLYEYIKRVLKIRRVSDRQLSLCMSCMDNPVRNMSRKLKSDMKISFIVAIADCLNCDVDIRFIDKDSGNEIV